MGENKLKTGLLGLIRGGETLLEAASGIDCLQIEAVADMDVDLAGKLAEKYNCTAYDDYRQLITQNQLDCLIVTAGLHGCHEHVRAAMKKRFNILKLPPLSRTFEEAAEFVRLADEQQIKFAVANRGRFAKGFAALRDYLEQGGIEHVFLVTAVRSAGRQHPSGWQTDPKLAGGGVLLYECYQIIDQLICSFSMPDQVYSATTNTAGDRQQRLYSTEDTALLTMKFSDAFLGNLIASSAFGPEEEFIKVYAKDRILTASSNRFVIADGSGKVEDEKQWDDDDLACTKRMLENFALSIASPDENEAADSAKENLTNMAVIESGYLSARTGMPEEPAKILQMAGAELGDVWPARK